ncbi:hypothetical protein [Psychrobacter cryohalolentis]|uniref:DUF4878 domain-containing protein n=1 Tax=Psychrobacter cryohalolentis (strain ATCC BAA-1226 / DSM 17306 / VKM B-2378 / K5) TaxID=335284 RepID=Q1Q936_PSYCK|nr:hypothetical protein [Psychrobacter cryohalolentis]ABE75817.1 conserved hypothetical protein [Psychrobacter cryohalolentis K5]ASE26004.1 hypothetical protein CEP87_05155 [Psychrobacter cryohalolentis]
MTTQQLAAQRLPMIFATGLLSAGLLISGCSDNNKVETQPADETTDGSSAINTVNSTDDVDSTPDVNKTDSIANSDTAKTDNDIVSQDISPIAAAVKEPSILTNRTEAGTPENTVKLALDTLYYGDVKKAASYYKVDMENFAEELKNTQFAFKQTVEAVTIIDTKYNSDKTKATVTGELRLKGQSEPAPLAYELQKINGEWKILG